MSNLNKWNEWYKDLQAAEPYGDTQTYRSGANWMAKMGPGTVEDWGCGKGWFRKFWSDDYIGVDGSDTPFADVKADLADYQSNPDYIFMRHVIEHNHQWQAILRNALMSFRKGFVLVLFTPLIDKTEVHYTAPIQGVPDIHFSLKDLAEVIRGTTVLVNKEQEQTIKWDLHTYDAPETFYGEETTFLFRKEPMCNTK